uniref:Taurine transport system substrate-binding protein n=1 Tax=Candidatus Kentrum eta TaxID=2126337 RepID=A0A450VDX9_9GAMM|nr:MAG: taurine transport system substrate-binding protein [Candidatus Kentron sp. H]VFJ97789.1 MAG: taurine transport system substrate-binding protein [Candidatus Kentron sp. H]VFK02970.1 MAG: taurine transport system substrate-binding protein [Candidatus Kentron sp. H]
MGMKKRLISIFSVVALAVMGIGVWGIGMAQKTDEITIAYFLEWPTPNQFAQARGIYEKELGVEINWRAFDTGTAMSAAMASGDVQIAFSQGIAPFVVATSAGQDLQVIDVSESYSESDNCVVRAMLEIDKTNPRDLEGKQVGVPLGTVAHYGFLKQMAYFGVDVSTMTIIDMAPPDSAAAFANGNLDMVCGWGGPLRRMKKHGNVLLTGAEKEALGIRVFDVTTVTAAWAKENAELLTGFLKVTADMNARFAAGEREAMLPVIAKVAGMDEEAARATIAGFDFPTVEAQLSGKWLGGGIQTFLKEVADFFVEQGVIGSARASYEGAVDASYLKAASKM